MNTHLLKGSCHCGAVKFEVNTPVAPAARCNCSLCRRKGALMTPPFTADQLTIKQGEDALTLYQFNTRVAKHLFCSECGVKGFYRPRSNPDGWSVNARCLDSTEGLDLRVEAFDGQNWEANAAGLAHLSKEPV